jgi:sarcosine oxidase subunit alpha
VSPNLRVLPTVPPRGQPCTIEHDGQELPAVEGEPLAVALFAGGVRVLARSPKFHRPRGAFCFDGHCGSCLLRVDGKPNVRACMVPVRPGLVCSGQNAFPSTDLDALALADWFFPGGMDHHTLMTGHRLANAFLVKLVRQMGGAGTLPDVAAGPRGRSRRARTRVVDVVVVGAGPAGLSAATALVGPDAAGRLAAASGGQIAATPPPPSVLVVDEQLELGGSWRAEPDGQARALALAADLRARGVEILTRTTAIAYYPEDRAEDRPEDRLQDPRDRPVERPSSTGVDLAHRPGGPAEDQEAPPGLLAVVSATEGLLEISARRFLYATGAYDQSLPFPDSDRPGILSARACGRLAFRHGVRPGGRIAIVGDDPQGDRLATDLVAAGLPAQDIERIADHRSIEAVHGANRLRAIVVGGHREAGGARAARRLGVDVLAVAAQPAPASELPRQHGAEVIFSIEREGSGGGFATTVDAQFRTTAPGVYACGDVTGYVGPERAARAGQAAGAAVARSLGHHRGTGPDHARAVP